MEKPTNSSRVVAKLSDPACRYMAAMYDPRSCTEEVAVPRLATDSEKFTSFIRGSVSTGTTGYGYIAVNPWTLVASDVGSGSMSTSASVMSSTTTITATTNTTGPGFSNSPYVNATFASAATIMRYRLVAAALYIKYAGTELNRGGDLLLMEEPNHAGSSNYTYTSALGLDGVKRVEVLNSWQHVCHTVYSDTDTTFGSSTAGPWAANTLLVFLNSAGVAGQPFDYEIYCKFEVVGTSARGATSSYNDPIGYNAVVGAADQFSQLDSVIGLNGFTHAVENQLDNVSGVARNATHAQNWAGLAALLPQIADVATRALSGAANGVIQSFSQPAASAAPRPRAPPPAVQRRPPPPPPPTRRAAAKQASARKK